jgi:hypothetical protein
VIKMADTTMTAHRSTIHHRSAPASTTAASRDRQAHRTKSGSPPLLVNNLA